jgi:tryptophanyl-tRNA synthetase
MSNIVLTGDRPTGKLHLGHYVGSMQNRVALQAKYDQCYYMIADLQALTDNADQPDKVRDNVLEVALDNLAVGLDPKKTTFFIQSQIPQISELTIIFLNLVTLARARRNPTIKNEMQQKGYAENVPMGFLTYPISQAADILFCNANIIPVGEDQLPIIEQDNEIVEKFNALYGETFRKITPLLSTTTRLVGIDGQAKASKSLGNAIFLDDDADVIQKKVMMMYTDPDHLKVTDPGKVEGNVVFDYLSIFDHNKTELDELKDHYRRGGLGDVIIKRRLIDILEELIAPIRTRRRELAKDPEHVMKLLHEGSLNARAAAEVTMAKVRKAMRIDY